MPGDARALFNPLKESLDHAEYVECILCNRAASTQGVDKIPGILEILSSQRRGGSRGAPFKSLWLHIQSPMFVRYTEKATLNSKKPITAFGAKKQKSFPLSGSQKHQQLWTKSRQIDWYPSWPPSFFCLANIFKENLWDRTFFSVSGSSRDIFLYLFNIASSEEPHNQLYRGLNLGL
jgi:hypothetical protein